MELTTHFYFIRHGQNIGYHQGRSNTVNPGLAPLGIAEAERLRERLAATGEIRADVLISSPLAQARETAEVIAPALELPVLIDDDCQEFRLGETEALPDEEIEARFGYFELEQEPFRQVAPGGDSLAGFALRVWGALDHLIRTYPGKTVVIVCHTGVIEAAFLYFLGLSPLRQLHLGLQNTSITHWRKGGSSTARWRLVAFNDHAHLLDLDSAYRIDWKALATKSAKG